tara:strand:+ start:3947 stop:4210 length:264 start_codon:yes stop_codon:yes gene_type:complete
MRKCAKECVQKNQKCSEKECRLWMDHHKDLNCSLVAIKRNGAMTLHEVADRLNMSYVRVKQIQDEAIAKIDKEEVRNELFVLEDGFF